MIARMKIVSRVVGAAIGGAGTYAAAVVLDTGLAMPIVFGIVGVMAVLGALFGPKVWEAVLQLF
jgi:hypothetical protein